jgi:hypothetical protein
MKTCPRCGYSENREPHWSDALGGVGSVLAPLLGIGNEQDAFWNSLGMDGDWTRLRQDGMQNVGCLERQMRAMMASSDNYFGARWEVKRTGPVTFPGPKSRGIVVG